MRTLFLGIALAVAAASAGAAQDLIPERRMVVTRGADFYGSDLAALFDTTLEACQAQCLNDPACGAFTYNTRSRACFPKSGVTEVQPYDGAISARVLNADPALSSQATARAADLDMLRPEDLEAARQEALALGLRHEGGDWDSAALLDAARQAEAQGDLRGAWGWTGAALAQSDAADLWLDYARLTLDRAEAGDDPWTLRSQALSAAVNGTLRAAPGPQTGSALLQLAQALQAVDRGRESVPALRLAQDLAPRPEIAAALEEARAQFGFRITDHEVSSDAADPRLCAQFSEPLAAAGVDYASFVRLPDPRLAVSAEDSRLCVMGLDHGQSYEVTFRAGLPSAEGEALPNDVPITAYVRDRTPAVRFPGRAYVLPKTEGAGLPVETVNLSQIDLTLRRVSDRSLIRTLQEDLFGRPLDVWEQDRFGADLSETIWTGRGEVENQLNADVTTRLPLGEVVGGLPAGIYALSAAVPGADPYDTPAATQWFVLSDIGLTTLSGTDGLTVFARALSGATPLQGLEVQLVSRANRVLETVQTDDQGVARFAAGLMRGTGGAAPALVLARQGEADLAFLSLTDPAFDLSDRGVAGRAPAGPVDAFLTTDRGAYRAGETIHATALLRDARVRAVTDLPLTAVLTRPDGVEHARQVSGTGVDGGHVLQFPLAPSVPRGTWRLALYGDPQAEPLTSTPLLVEDFVPERLDLTLSLPEGPLTAATLPRLQVQADYLFGAPGADLPLEGEVTLTPLATLEALPGYSFGRHDAPGDPRRDSLAAALRTDAEGAADLLLPLPDPASPGQPQELRATLRVAEGSGRPVERSLTRPLLPEAAMLGIRPEFDGTLPEGTEASFLLQAFGADLAPVSAEVEWQVNRIETRYQWYQLYGSWNWEPVTSRSTIATGTATLGGDPVRVSADLDWGQYELVVARTDGAYSATSVGFEAGWYAPAGAVATPDMLDLSLDQPAYAPGETAQLRVVPRHAGKALITVLSDHVIAMQAVDLPEGETVIDLPVTDEWGAGAYVTAQLLRPMDQASGQQPARSLGLAHAAIAPGDRALEVSLDTATEAAPRGPLRAAVVLDSLPEGETAHVTVAAVDLGILNLTGFESPDPLEHYFGQRRLGVEIRDIYGRLIDGSQGAMGRLRSGGDAGAMMRLESPPPTEDLVAFFSGPVTVGPDGRAEVSFDLPDFNGTVRLMAVAWTKTAVGQAQADVLVRDPVVIAAALPRFLAPGDQTRLALDLTHTTGAAGEMALEVSAEGLMLGAAPATVTLPEGGSTRITLPLTAAAPGDHAITVALTTPDGQRLTKTLTVGVRANDPQVASTRRLTLDPGDSFTLDAEILSGLLPDSAEVMVSAGPMARFDVPGLLASLDRYPYGCTEQVTSQALPLLSLAPLAGPLGLGDAARITQRIDQAVARVLTRQAGSGGFGLWRAEAGDLWLDAYVTDFLSRARAAGHEVPDRAFTSALDNLRNRVAYAPDFEQGGEDLAYALLVLAREGQAAIGDLRYYADQRAGAFATPLAQAQLGAALAAYGEQTRADAMFSRAGARLAGASAAEGQVWRSDYGSVLRDAAATLALGIEARSAALDRPALAALVAEAGRPLSPQEQAWSLMAARALVDDPAASGLTLDGAPVSGPLLRRIPGAELAPMTLANTASTPTALTLTTLGVPEGATEAGGTGYTLERAYYRMDGTPLDGEVAQGDRLVTVLTIRPAEDVRARLMLDDPLPAGFEIDNPTLLRAGDLRGLDWLESATPDHAEFRSDRFLAALTQEGTAPIRLAYVVRAVSPGRFHHPAALVLDMYRPDYRATTASGTLDVQ